MPLTDAFRDQLAAESNLQLTLSEGAARRLNDLFLQRSSGLGLALEISCWHPSQLHQQGNNDELVYESLLIGGMLNWLAQGQSSEYRTRSVSVARAAARLQAIGYNIGHIEKWDGTGLSPPAMVAKT